MKTDKRWRKPVRITTHHTHICQQDDARKINDVSQLGIHAIIKRDPSPLSRPRLKLTDHEENYKELNHNPPGLLRHVKGHSHTGFTPNFANVQAHMCRIFILKKRNLGYLERGLACKFSMSN